MFFGIVLVMFFYYDNFFFFYKVILFWIINNKIGFVYSMSKMINYIIYLINIEFIIGIINFCIWRVMGYWEFCCI